MKGTYLTDLPIETRKRLIYFGVIPFETAVAWLYYDRQGETTLGCGIKVQQMRVNPAAYTLDNAWLNKLYVSTIRKDFIFYNNDGAIDLYALQSKQS